MKKNFKVLKMAILYTVLFVVLTISFLANKKASAQLPPPASNIFLLTGFSTEDYRRVTVTVSWKENGVDKSLDYTTLLYDLK